MTLEEIEPKLGAILARLTGLRFAYVFGSAVSRGLEDARDLDIALDVARPFSLLEQGRLARELEAIAGKEVDLVDLETASTLLRWEVLTTGKVLVAPDAEALLEFKALTPIEWADLRPYFDREAAGLRRALGV